MPKLSTLAKKVAAGVRCDASGSCVVFAHDLCSAASSGFQVVEGTVRFKGSVSFDHVWIEASGAKVDPTLLQFGFFNLATVEYSSNKNYQPEAFARRIRRHPQFARFTTLRK